MNQQSAAVSISRQHWQALLDELAEARRQRHLVTYRALLERLQLPTPAMQTLTAALEHLAALDARSGVRCVAPWSSARVPAACPHRFLRVCRSSGAFQRPCRRLCRRLLACRGSGACIRVRLSGGALMLWELRARAGYFIARKLMASRQAVRQPKLWRWMEASSHGWRHWAM